MIDPASMGDWAQASLLGVSFGALAVAGALALRQAQRAEELVPVEVPVETERVERARMVGATRGA